MNKSFYTITDTREVYAWNLYDPSILGNETIKLDTGDYSIRGLEDKFTIDRKMTVSEIAQNINQKRFYRELERMKSIPLSYILLECSLEDIQGFPQTANLPPKVKNKIRTNGNYILKKIEQMKEEYGVLVYYCINRQIAEDIAIRLMKEAIKIYG